MHAMSQERFYGTNSPKLFEAINWNSRTSERVSQTLKLSATNIKTYSKFPDPNAELERLGELKPINDDSSDESENGRYVLKINNEIWYDFSRDVKNDSWAPPRITQTTNSKTMIVNASQNDQNEKTRKFTSLELDNGERLNFVFF